MGHISLHKCDVCGVSAENWRTPPRWIEISMHATGYKNVEPGAYERQAAAGVVILMCEKCSTERPAEAINSAGGNALSGLVAKVVGQMA